MKNKLFLFSLGLIILLTGCSNENDASSSTDGNSMASFRLELPGATTRAAGDTYTPTRYIMEVYPDKAATGIPLMHIEQDSGTFDVSLTYGTTYTCLFWADNGTPDNIVNDEYETADLKAVKAKADIPPTSPAYGGMAQVTAGISSSADYSVTLKHAVAKVSYIQDQRPFTSTGNTLTVTFPKTCQLNVSDWSVNEIADATITHTFTGISQVVAGDRLATSYVIAPSVTADMQNITVALNQEPPKTISNVPLQRNYNTNIKGTYSDLYNSDMNCQITEEWDTPETEKDLISIWDGKTVTEPADYSADAPGEVLINSAAELAWLAEQSNATNQKTFKDYTFTLTTDIDLRSHLWQQIGHSKNGFQGTLNGNGHTVRGIYANNGGTEKYVGFINYLNRGGTVKNLTVRGYVSGTNTTKQWYYFGGLVGCVEKSVIENCNNACTLAVGGEEGNFYAGGIVGSADDTSIQSCTSDGTIKNTGNSSAVVIGGIVGNWAGGMIADAILSGNVHKGKIVYTSISNGAKIGGIAGWVDAWGTIIVSNNVNNGEVAASSGEHVTYNTLGAIIGNLFAFSKEGSITVSGNQNKGNISSDYEEDYKGGIIGRALPSANLPITLTDNSIAGGTPADIVIADCSVISGTITVDGVPVTDTGKPYPVPSE